MQALELLTQTQKIALASLKQSHGIKIGAAARHAGVTRSTVHQWINEISIFRDTVYELREALVDDIETTALAAARVDAKHSTTMLERLRPEVYGDAKQGGGPAVVVQVNTFDGTQTDGVVTARGVTIQQQPAQQITQQLAIDADAITIDLGDWGAA